jgi:hypothetical protein
VPSAAGIYRGGMSRTEARDDIWLHVILCVLTLGLWLPIWFLIWLGDVVEGWISDLLSAIFDPIFRLLGGLLVLLGRALTSVLRRVAMIFYRPRA